MYTIRAKIIFISNVMVKQKYQTLTVTILLFKLVVNIVPTNKVNKN